jgi:hypothetical protein
MTFKTTVQWCQRPKNGKLHMLQVSKNLIFSKTTQRYKWFDVVCSSDRQDVATTTEFAASKSSFAIKQAKWEE